MPKKPPIDEIDFLKCVRNHAELARHLDSLKLPVPDLLEYVQHVTKCWFDLASEHLDDARKSHSAGCVRATLSRAYYAAYNASKGIRYSVYGEVSLKSDDHAKASQLPDDFPTPDVWAEEITKLYANRLLADYDNWASTGKAYTLTPESALHLADEFVKEARKYLTNKFGISL
jgi:hypothetical protein